MKKLFLSIGFALVLIAMEYITYYTIAQKKLPELAIKHLIVNTSSVSDTILFGSTMSIYDNPENPIIPYDLPLTAPEHFKELQKKLSKYTLINEEAYAIYCESVAKQHPKNPEYKSNLLKNKSKLYITAIEENMFTVTVNTNWSYKSQFYFTEDHYFWFLFNWVKI
jgi:hypothetical protein